MLRFLSVFSLLLLSFASFAIEYTGFELKDNRLLIKTDEQTVQVTPLSAHSIEVLYLAEPNFPSFAIKPKLDNSKVAVNLQEDEHSLIFKTKQLTLIINKKALTMSFFNQDKRLSRHHIDRQTKLGVRFTFDLDKNEKLMGAGQRVLGMDRRGHKLPLYNRAHYGYTTHSEQMNYGLPAVMSDKKYSLLFDNSAKGELDLASSEKDRLVFSAEGGRASFIVTSANSYPELIKQYVKITGTQPMPARWTLGNHASRFGYKTQKQVLDTISLYRQLDIPVDSVILDLYWFGKDVQGHMGNLSWDKTAFPEPKQMIEQLKELGVKTTLITEPFVLKNAKRHDEAKQAGALALNFAGDKVKYYDFFFGHTALVDVFSQQGQTWFSQIYQELAEQGVTGVWGDLGEPEVHPEDMQHQLTKFGVSASANEVHNAYGHQWAELVFNSLKQHQPNTRPFILMRSGFAGSQRFGLIPWTGDVSRSWGGLKPQVELSLQMSLFGLAYTHSDLGGFAGDEYDKEMYIRWLQYGVFQPIYRPHAQDKVPSEPVFHDQQTQDILRSYIKLRYAMLPYNYTLAYENSLTGMPLMRPMFFSDEKDSELIDIKDQFMWGDSFLVKPVTDPDVTKVGVSLPKGNWFDYWTGKKYSGQQQVTIDVDLTTIPVLVKAGSMIPTIDPVQSTRDYSSKNLTLDFYFDPEIKQSSTKMYEDDGVSANAISAQKYELLHFAAKQQNHNLLFELKREIAGTYEGIPEHRSIELNIHNWTKTADVKLSTNNKALEKVSSAKQFNAMPQAVFYDGDNNILRVKFQWQQDQQNLLIGM